MIKKSIIAAVLALVIEFPVISMGLEIDWVQYKRYYPNMAAEHFAIVRHECLQQNVPMSDVFAIIANESQYNDCIISKSCDYVGLMQINRVHWNGSATDMLNLTKNVKAGVAIYKSALIKAKGDKRSAFRYYNAGEGNTPDRYKNWNYVNTIQRDILMSSRFAKKLSYFEVVLNDGR